MATILDKLSYKSVGTVSMQQGETDDGVPNHEAINGTIFIDTTYNNFWKKEENLWVMSPNISGGNLNLTEQTTSISISADVWSTIGSFYTWTLSESIGIYQPENYQIAISEGFGGNYLIYLSATIVQTEDSDVNVDIGISINGFVLEDEHYFSSLVRSTTFSPSTYIIYSTENLNENDYLQIGGRSSSSLTNTLILRDANLFVIKID